MRAIKWIVVDDMKGANNAMEEVTFFLTSPDYHLASICVRLLLL